MRGSARYKNAITAVPPRKRYRAIFSLPRNDQNSSKPLENPLENLLYLLDLQDGAGGAAAR